MNLQFKNQFNLKKKIGQGAFGELYKAINIKNGEQVAVKLEKINTATP